LKILLFLVFVLACVWAWRSWTRADAPAGSRPQPDGMTVAEARAVLGLADGVTPDDVIAAHRRLMQRVHPDKGGSAHLARQLNEAKRVLLRNR
jgi:hypothetical protein